MFNLDPFDPVDPDPQFYFNQFISLHGQLHWVDKVGQDNPK